MSDTDTAFSPFVVRDYTNSVSVSTYALPFTPITVIHIPSNLEEDLSNVFSDKRIVWDFGDGTSVEAVTATHTYLEPGKYKVGCFFYDSAGDSYFNIFTQDIDVYNYITDGISVSASKTNNIVLTAGKYTDPFLVTTGTSWQYYGDDRNKPVTVTGKLSGSSIVDYFDNNLQSLPYSHLYPYSSLYLNATSIDGRTEFIEISSFNPKVDQIFIKLEDNKIIRTTGSDPESFFCGTTGFEYVYYKDDIPSSKTNILFGYEPNTIKPFSNTSTVGVSASVIPNVDYHRLSITSNGIDSEGNTTTTFNIGKNKFNKTKISFVVKVKDSENFTIKTLPSSLSQSLSFYLVYTNNPPIVTEDLLNVIETESLIPIIAEDIPFLPFSYFTLTGVNTSNFFKGYFIPDITTNTLGVVLSANASINNITISGESVPFNIYQSDFYSIGKKNEDIDFAKQFQDIAFQPLFTDNKVLFKDFLGSIFGDLEAAQTSLGKVAYEKISNFVDNNDVLDYCNINQLISILRSMDGNDVRFQSSNFVYPGDLGRLINLLTINKNRLFGVENTYSNYFNNYGYANTDTYSKNLGSQVSINYTITAGTDIVAYEKFSGIYKRLNTYLPLCAAVISLTGTQYHLKDYNVTWGWDLVLPDNFTNAPPLSSASLENIEDLNGLYLFYEYIPREDGTITDSIINFYDPNTQSELFTTTYEDWSKQDGVIANIITNQLYKGLNLFT
jgi:hypothetical protein